MGSHSLNIFYSMSCFCFYRVLVCLFSHQLWWNVDLKISFLKKIVSKFFKGALLFIVWGGAKTQRAYILAGLWLLCILSICQKIWKDKRQPKSANKYKSQNADLSISATCCVTYRNLNFIWFLVTWWHVNSIVVRCGKFDSMIRIKSEWCKFRDVFSLLATSGFACVCSIVLYGSSAWPVQEEDVIRLARNDLRMVRWMSNLGPD